MFRVVISGKFIGLDDTGRAAVLAANGAGFTEAGRFTHDASVSAFTFRCQVPVDPDDGEHEATQRAIRALDAYGLPYHPIRIAATDMREIKIRQKGRWR
ncbi:DUF6204 family protein [Plantactinospora soyae]|uniref:Uncharacterized protein n=1 Tax=Plantactinospora soyae TaxID=1544732 RepID=A0A927M4F6_9ACTN|nr:DUF6204 family protein [Plantactinospora soyae]MBE1486456.1 hypothetical protein [Plantactinospora soyae]